MQQRFFPYPADPAEKFGFIAGYIIAAAITVLIFAPIFIH